MPYHRLGYGIISLDNRCFVYMLPVVYALYVRSSVLEYGLMGAQRVPQFVHTMQMAPVAPPYTSWMNPDPKTGHIPGIKLAGKDDPRFKTHLGTSYSQVSKDGFPRTGG